MFDHSSLWYFTLILLTLYLSVMPIWHDAYNSFLVRFIRTRILVVNFVPRISFLRPFLCAFVLPLLSGAWDVLSNF